MVWWLEILRATATNRRAQNKSLMRPPAQGLNLDKHTIQEAHDAPWIGVCGSNKGPELTSSYFRLMKTRYSKIVQFLMFQQLA